MIALFDINFFGFSVISLILFSLSRSTTPKFSGFLQTEKILNESYFQKYLQV